MCQSFKFNHKIIAEYANSLMSLINTFYFKEHKIHLIEENAMQLKLGSHFYFLKTGVIVRVLHTGHAAVT